MAKEELLSTTQDWPLALIRSEAKDTLARQLYEADCKWRRVRPDWPADGNQQTRAACRALAQRILEGGIK